MENILEVKNIETIFHTNDGILHAVNGVSIDLKKGETLGVVGESGCGKSVTMMSMLRLIPRPPGELVNGSSQNIGRRDEKGTWLKDLNSFPRSDDVF